MGAISSRSTSTPIPRPAWFFTRMEIGSHTLAVDLPALRQEFAPIAAELQAQWTIRTAQARRKVARDSPANLATAWPTSSGAGAPANSTSRSRRLFPITKTCVPWSSARVSSSAILPVECARQARGLRQDWRDLPLSCSPISSSLRPTCRSSSPNSAPSSRANHQHSPLVSSPASLGINPHQRAPPRGETHRRHVPLHHRRARRRPDRRPGGNPRGALPCARRNHAPRRDCERLALARGDSC